MIRRKIILILWYIKPSWEPMAWTTAPSLHVKETDLLIDIHWLSFKIFYCQRTYNVFKFITFGFSSGALDTRRIQRHIWTQVLINRHVKLWTGPKLINEHWKPRNYGTREGWGCWSVIFPFSGSFAFRKYLRFDWILTSVF